MRIAGPGLNNPQQVRKDQKETAERYTFSKHVGDGVGGFVSGAVDETVDSAVNSPKLLKDAVVNLYNAETIGPNLKFLGTLAALPGTALSVVVAPAWGGCTGASQAFSAAAKSEGPLPQGTVAEYTHERFHGDSETLSTRLQNSMKELGAAKLKPGEKPYDVPVMSPAFSLAGGVASAAISGSVGLVAGLAAGLLTTGKEAVAGVRSGEIGRVVASPLHTVAIPYGLIKEGLLESVPRGFSDGWDHGPVKPIVDTAKVSATLATSVLKEAWER